MSPAQRNSRRLEEAYVSLVRASSLAHTSGIVISERDLPVLDDLTGSRVRSHELISGLESAGRLRAVRRGAYVLVDSAGVVRTDVLDLVAPLLRLSHT